MEQKDLMAQLDKEVPEQMIESLHVVEAGKIKIVDIEKVDQKEFTFTEGDKQRVVKRFFLTIKGQSKKVLVPRSVMTQLNALMKKGKMVAFAVLKTGSGITTKYNLVPEMTL